MSQFFPHTPYAEDQPLGKLILTSHVLYRGLQSGAIVGNIIGPVSYLFSARVRARNAKSILAVTTRSVATGSFVGTALMIVALPMRMKGMEDIEWKDRSWRLLENKGQMEVDSWSLTGMGFGLGSLAVVPTRSRAVRGWRLVLGRAGLGGNIGILGYMMYRYGFHKGKWKEDDLLTIIPKA